MSLGELAALAGAGGLGESDKSRAIHRASSLNDADGGCVVFCADQRHLGDLRTTRAGACFLPPNLAHAAPPGCVALTTAFPQASYALAANRLHTPRLASGEGGVSPDATIEGDVVLAAGAAVGEGAQIGQGSHIGPNAVVGPGVAIGRDCRIGAGALVGFALVGDRVTISAGAIVGEAGFGAAAGPGGLVDIPQLGRVILQDGVSIGAGACVDRGAFDDTVVGENTKIDNLVQIAHNVRIGRNCLFAAHTGVSGSVTIGDGCFFGGRAGIADHLVIGAGARIAAASGVMKDVPPGETWGGYPARPMGRWMRETAWLARAVARPSMRGKTS